MVYLPQDTKKTPTGWTDRGEVALSTEGKGYDMNDSISKTMPDQSQKIRAFTVSQRGTNRADRDQGQYSLIDIEKSKRKALAAINLREYLMWCQIERGIL